MTVAIVTDSGSDLTPAQLRDNQIKQVPLSVSFGEETYLSPDEMTPEVFWERLLAPDSPFPHTAAPSIGLFKRAFEEAFADGHEAVICICLSGDLSATFKHARLAGEMLPDRPITIVDSRLASIATGALALSAARLAESGASVAEIESRLAALREGMGLYIGLDTLEYLRKGGRISHAKAAIGGLLSVKPVITMVDGLVVVAEQPRTRSKAFERVLALMTGRPAAELHLLYSPPTDPDALRDAVLARMPGPPPALVTCEIIGPVIGAHVGPGAYGGVMVRDV